MICRYLFILCTVLVGCQAALQVKPNDSVVLPTFEPKKPIHLALVLGGGGSKGLAHLGAIQELEKAGIRPDLIVGCSAGAIAGALYADRPELEEVCKTFIRLKKADILDYSFFKPLLGIVDGIYLQNLMNKTLHAKTFEELGIPLILITTDLITGETVELCSGEISPSIRASCAFPGMFKPVYLYGRYFVDGGVSCPIPVNIAKKYGADIVIVIDLTERLPKATPWNLFGVTKRSLEITYRKFVEQSLREADVVIRMNFEDIGTFSDHLNEKLYEHGRAAIREQLPDIQRKLALAESKLNRFQHSASP